jgi:hypothetical protein
LEHNFETYQKPVRVLVLVLVVVCDKNRYLDFIHEFNCKRDLIKLAGIVYHHTFSINIID